MSPTTSINVIVVGGGIGGLSTAIALRKAGHSVKVLERSGSATGEAGAAVTVPANATRILRSWGMDFAKARMVPYTAMQVLRGDIDPMREVFNSDFRTIEKSFGAPYLLSHRVDLHDALLSMATSQGIGIPVEIVSRAAVASYDAHAGSVTLKDSSILMADLVVAADGVHSQAHRYILGYENPAVATGTTVIRFMLPTADLREDPHTALLVSGGEGHGSIYTAADGLRWLVRYPCRNNELQNFGAYSLDPKEDAAVKTWNAASNRDSLLQRLQGFHPAIIDICEKKTNEILPLWKCTEREPLPQFHLGRLVLVGDACHPMLPHIGQGAAQSIEDAAILGVLCSELPDASAIPERLKLFESVRKQRVSAIQILSRPPVGVNSTEQIAAKLRAYFPVGQIPKDRKETTAFCMSYDAIQEASDALRKHADGTYSEPALV